MKAPSIKQLKRIEHEQNMLSDLDTSKMIDELDVEQLRSELKKAHRQIKRLHYDLSSAYRHYRLYLELQRKIDRQSRKIPRGWRPELVYNAD
jgi:hypothetical protein